MFKNYINCFIHSKLKTKNEISISKNINDNFSGSKGWIKKSRKNSK